MMVTPGWLNDRGGLHDARVGKVRSEVGALVLEIDDEWSNEYDSKDDSRGGHLRFSSAAVVTGNLSEVEGGWVSEIEITDGGTVSLSFCDRDILVLEAQRVDWIPRA